MLDAGYSRVHGRQVNLKLRRNTADIRCSPLISAPKQPHFAIVCCYPEHTPQDTGAVIQRMLELSRKDYEGPYVVRSQPVSLGYFRRFSSRKGASAVRFFAIPWSALGAFLNGMPGRGQHPAGALTQVLFEQKDRIFTLSTDMPGLLFLPFAGRHPPSITEPAIAGGPCCFRKAVTGQANSSYRTFPDAAAHRFLPEPDGRADLPSPAAIFRCRPSTPWQLPDSRGG